MLVSQGLPQLCCGNLHGLSKHRYSTNDPFASEPILAWLQRAMPDLERLALLQNLGKSGVTQDHIQRNDKRSKIHEDATLSSRRDSTSGL